MRYSITLLNLLIPLLLSAQDGEFDAYYPENKLYRELGVKEIRRATHYGTPDTSIYVTTFDSFGRITSENTGYRDRTTYFVYEQQNDTLIRISYREATEKYKADTFMVELFVYNKAGKIINYYNFNTKRYTEHITGSNCTNGIDLSNLHSTFYNESFYYDKAGNCLYKHYSVNKWVDVPFTVDAPPPFEHLVFTNTYAYKYNANGNMITKTGVSGDKITGDVDSFFYSKNQLVRKITNLEKYYTGNKDFIEIKYTNSIENGLKVTTIEEAASYRNRGYFFETNLPDLSKNKYYYDAKGLLVRTEDVRENSIIVCEVEYGFY